MEVQYRSQTGFSPRDVVVSLPGAIAAHRPCDGEILFANDEMVALLECSDVNDLIRYANGTFDEIIHPDDRERFAAQLAQQPPSVSYRVGEAGFLELRVVTKHDNVRKVANTRRITSVSGVGDVVYELFMACD